MRNKNRKSFGQDWWVSIIFGLATSGFLAFGVGLEVAGQIIKKTPTPTPERPSEIVTLLNEARLAAPELGVDILLKIVESKKVTDQAWKKEILDEALRIVDDVKNPVQLRPVPIRGVSLNNTEAYLTAVAHSQKLDRLSLKSRIIKLLVDTDRERSKQIIFEMGGTLGLKPRSCNDNLTYEVADIYSAVGRVAKAVFTENQIVEGRRALYVAPWLENIDSPTQISPALELLEEMQGSAAERQMLFNSLSRAINRNFNDDRSFTAAFGWGGGLGTKLEKLVSGEQDPLKTDLNLAYRDFLLKNLRGMRCKDNEIKKEEPLPPFIEAANKLLPQKPLGFEDVRASGFSETGKFVDILARSASVQKLKQELIPLKGKVVDNKFVNNSGPEWESRVTEFVEKLLAWEGGNNETESETLFVKAAMFGSILESIDDGKLKTSVLRKYLRLLAASPLQRNSFIEWRSYLRFVREKNESLFIQLALELPNSNFNAMVAAKKLGI